MLSKTLDCSMGIHYVVKKICALQQVLCSGHRHTRGPLERVNGIYRERSGGIGPTPLRGPSCKQPVLGAAGVSCVMAFHKIQNDDAKGKLLWQISNS